MPCACSKKRLNSQVQTSKTSSVPVQKSITPSQPVKKASIVVQQSSKPIQVKSNLYAILSTAAVHATNKKN